MGTVPVQSLLLGSKTKYFPVYETSISGGPGSLDVANQSSPNIDLADDEVRTAETERFQSFVDIMSEQKMPSKRSGYLDDENMLNEFIYRTRFDKVLKRSNWTMEKAVFLSGKAMERRICGTEKSLCELSVMYLRIYRDLEEFFSPNVLLKFSLKPGHSFRCVDGKTLESYGRVLGRFIISAYRHSLEQPSRFDSRSIKKLVSSCAKDGDQDEDLLKLFHESLKGLCLIRVNEIGGVEGLFVRSFLACCCVYANRSYERSDFRFCHSYEISPIAAVVQYVISFSALVELWLTGKRCSAEGMNQEKIDETSKKVESELISILDVEGNTAASFVRYVLNICNHQNENYTTESRFLLCEKHFLCGFLKGVELSMENLGPFLRKWQSQAEELMGNHLLMGGEYPPSHEGILFGLKDDVTNRSNGYSFLEHLENRSNVISLSSHVLRTIHKNGKGTNRIFAFDSATAKSDAVEGGIVKLGKYALIRNGVEKWLRKSQELQEILLACLHLSSGSPARATEIATYKLCNTQAELRNIYILQNRVHVLSRYSKQRKISGKDKPVLRIPDKETSSLLKKYFVLFRPVEAKFVRALHGPLLEKPHIEYVFSCVGESYSPERIRQVIRQFLNDEGKDMGIADYRNHPAAMVRLIAHHSMRFVSEILDEFASIGHEQAGHSMKIADRIYGRSALDFAILSADDINRYKCWALDYHRALFQWEINGKSDIKEEVNDFEDPGFKGFPERQIVNCRKPELHDLVQKVNDIGEKVDQIAGKRKKIQEVDHEQDGHSSISGRPTKLLVTKMGRQASVTISAPVRRNGGKEAVYLLPYLRKMMRNTSALFRSQTQADICGAILDSTDNIFAIAGTGFGKTLCFLLPIFVAGPRYSSIIIVPLASLVAELLSKMPSLRHFCPSLEG